ncbi:MAG: alpha-amylase family glycosyl hydrolase [Planctomycetota bacterium]
MKTTLPRPPVPAWLHNAVIYQVYPQSYQDSNGDGIGDLPGLISRLDYIQSLGVDALWLNPVFDSPFADAGYDVCDFRRIAPRYGNNDDAQRLFQEAHRRGLKVIFDLVAGHTSDQHPWFVESARLKHGALSDRYIWTPSKCVRPDDFVVGKHPRDGCYKPNFFDCQPALNYGYGEPDPAHPWQQPVDAPGPQATLAELRDIMAFWLEQGCDGFRVDMAASLIKNDPGYKETYTLWNGIRNEFGRKYPDSVLIAEWGNPEQAIRAGFHIDFMLHFGAPGYPSLFFNEQGTFHHPACFFDTRGKGAFTEFYQNWLAGNKAINGLGFIAIPSANHDFQRPHCLPRDDSQLRVVWAFLLTWPGVPFIYYGDEIGMRFVEPLPDKEGSVLPMFSGANRAGARTPMQWDAAAANAGFSTADANDLYLPIDPNPERPTVSMQAADPQSLLNFVRRLIALRKTDPALGSAASVECLSVGPCHYPVVYLREAEGRRVLVALNPAGVPGTASVKLECVSEIKPLLTDKTQVAYESGRTVIKMDRVAFGIFEIIATQSRPS